MTAVVATDLYKEGVTAEKEASGLLLRPLHVKGQAGRRESGDRMRGTHTTKP